MMLSQIEARLASHPAWQEFCKTLATNTSLTTLVLTASQIGIWIARVIVEQQLAERAKVPTKWACCSVCGTRLTSKGFAKRQMLTLVGLVEWKRRVGRCPHHCPGSQRIPLDEALKIQAYQQTSTELIGWDAYWLYSYPST